MGKHVIGLDIGGTKIWASKFALDGSPIGTSVKIPTESIEGAAHVVNNIVSAIEKLADQNTKAVGISWAGFVDSQNGVIKNAPNISGFCDYPLVKIIHEMTHLPIVVENDARLFAYGEALSRQTVPSSLLGIIIGTGVGSGIILNGEIYTGHTGYAGEIGHMLWGDTEIETLIAGRGIDAAVVDFGYENMTYQERNEMILADKKKHSDALAPNIEAFGKWLAGLALAYDPEVVVIGGGAATHFWKFWEDEILAVARESLDTYPTQLRLEWSEIKNAGAVGAAIMAARIIQ